MNVQLSYLKQPCICIKMNWTLSSAQKCGLFSVLTENLLTVRNGLINKKVSFKKNSSYTDIMLKLKIEKGHPAWHCELKHSRFGCNCRHLIRHMKSTFCSSRINSGSEVSKIFNFTLY